MCPFQLRGADLKQLNCAAALAPRAEKAYLSVRCGARPGSSSSQEDAVELT
jgi:hypothetical protein